ncbi:unnamed protein product [Moneuplotes crassus]|uniref:Uncharacterized protein n=1 Tax=Euplotes crassus TaxID=5936 RepID=A0AAD1XT19_EUPCR|nr:unnamed protein product [Moneuplotes crassus]
MDYYYQDLNDSAPELTLPPKISLENIPDRSRLPKINNPVNFSNEYILKSMKNKMKEISNQKRQNLSLSTTSLPGKLLRKDIPKHVVKKSLNNTKSVKSTKKITLRLDPLCREMPFQESRRQKITKFAFPINKSVNSFSAKKSYFEEFAQKKASLPSPSKYNIHQTWDLLEGNKRTPYAKRGSLIAEIIKRSKNLTSSINYPTEHKIKVKGIYKNKAPKHQYFDHKFPLPKIPGAKHA